jgi:lambda family phage minor tail protein L
MANILTTAQRLDPGAIVSLFQLDTRKVGGQILYFVQGNELEEEVKFGGRAYTPIDCEFEGLEVTGVGDLPQPTIRLSNTDGIAQTAINTFGDLLGCMVTRIRTFARHLDGHSDADEDAYFGPDMFEIERKVSENPVFIEWELSASIDQEGKQLPGRQLLRNTCLARYREWTDGAWDYSMSDDGMCPYTGSNYFDENDQAVASPTNDVPSRTITCCEKRFGKKNPLYTWAFPGIGRAQG